MIIADVAGPVRLAVLLAGGTVVGGLLVAHDRARGRRGPGAATTTSRTRSLARRARGPSPLRLRQRPVPHRGHRPGVGQRSSATPGSSAPTGATSSRAQFLAMGTGPLHVPKLPGIPGIEDFQGHSFHTSRWDYGYTGGDPLGHAAGEPGRQAGGHHRHRRDRGAVRPAPGPAPRSCTSSSARRRRSTSATTTRSTRSGSPRIDTPGWQQRWLENFTANQAGGRPPKIS